MTTVIQLQRVTKVIQSQRGQKGDKGDPGGGSSSNQSIAVAFGDVSDRIAYTMPAAGRIQTVSLDIDTAWDGVGASLSATCNGVDLMPAWANDPATATTYEFSAGEHFPLGAQIHFYNSPGAGATQGAGFLVLEIILD